MRNFLVIILALSCIGATAQRRRSSTKYKTTPQLSADKVVRTPIDTIVTPEKDTYVIIYSNNTWEFLRPTMSDLEKLPIFKHNWDTTSIFSYRNIALEDMPSSMEIKLVTNLDDFCVPIKGTVGSKYGPRGRRGRKHNGVDIPLRIGEPILAAFDGKVRYAKYNTGGFGYLVIVRHRSGLETYSAHMSRLNVKPGDYVKSGQVIGFGGNTGRSFGPHLHFEVRYMDQSFDPEHIIDFESGSLRYLTFALEKRYFNIHSRASEMLEEDEDDNIVGAHDILAAAQAPDVDNVEQGEAKVVEKPKPKPSTVYHYVTKGDVLSKLAIKYGVTVDQICKLSGITRTSTLQLKQRLRIK